MLRDEFANATIIRTADHTGHLAGMASEEMEEIYHIPDKHPRGNYILVFDPVDGSSNIDVNVSIGTIFSIYLRKSTGSKATLEDFLRKGSEQLCAGYIIYGSSTMLLYTTGQGVQGFTLGPTIGEFLLKGEVTGSSYTARYIGSLVSDFHRNLLKGGIFLYPADKKAAQGKLRLIYEAAPLAFVVQQAGGRKFSISSRRPCTSGFHWLSAAHETWRKRGYL